MGSGLVPRVGSAVVWDPGGPEAFQEEGSLSRRGLEGLTRDDPSWATICLSSHERASLARGPRVWSGLGPGLALGLDLGLPPGVREDGELIDRRAGTQTGR